MRKTKEYEGKDNAQRDSTSTKAGWRNNVLYPIDFDDLKVSTAANGARQYAPRPHAQAGRQAPPASPAANGA